MPLEDGSCKDDDDGLPDDDGTGEATEREEDEEAAERLRSRVSGRSSGWLELPSPRETDEGKIVASDVSIVGRCISSYVP